MKKLLNVGLIICLVVLSISNFKVSTQSINEIRNAKQISDNFMLSIY